MAKLGRGGGVVVAVLVGTLAASAGCARRSQAGERISTARDSLVGVIAVTGSSFEEQLMLKVADGAIRLRAGPADSAALKRLSGVELVVRGSADASGFAVRSFTVLRVDGQPVADGVLRRDRDRLVLETATGVRLALGKPLPAFSSMVGARVWIGGALDRGPNVYGVIVPSP